MVLQPEFIAHVFAVGVVTFYSFAAHSVFSFNHGIRAQVSRALQRTRPSWTQAGLRIGSSCEAWLVLRRST